LLLLVVVEVVQALCWRRGAGGFRTGTGLPVSFAPGSYTVTVGSGGAGGPGGGDGSNGNPSIFSTITSTGGGLLRVLLQHLDPEERGVVVLVAHLQEIIQEFLEQ
jgi:hypothetical protein